MGNIKVVGLDQLTKTLKRAERNLPTFRAQNINDMAFHSRTLAQGNIRNDFDLRNGGGTSDWTVRSVGVKKATKNPKSVAITGSLQEYMKEQEFGNSSLKIKSIPTDDARISKSRDRRTSPRKRLRLGGIGTANVRATGNKNSRIEIMKARRTNTRKLFDLTMSGKKGRTRGLYRFDRSMSDDIVMIQNLTKKTSIRQNPWLGKTRSPTIEKGKRIAARHLSRLLKRV